jgi:hypothetical protein
VIMPKGSRRCSKVVWFKVGCNSFDLPVYVIAMIHRVSAARPAVPAICSRRPDREARMPCYCCARKRTQYRGNLRAASEILIARRLGDAIEQAAAVEGRNFSNMVERIVA